MDKVQEDKKPFLSQKLNKCWCFFDCNCWMGVKGVLPNIFYILMHSCLFSRFKIYGQRN